MGHCRDSDAKIMQLYKITLVTRAPQGGTTVSHPPHYLIQCMYFYNTNVEFIICFICTFAFFAYIKQLDIVILHG